MLKILILIVVSGNILSIRSGIYPLNVIIRTGSGLKRRTPGSGSRINFIQKSNKEVNKHRTRCVFSESFTGKVEKIETRIKKK